MKIVRLPLGPLYTNAYIVKDVENQRGIVIDPAYESDSLTEELKGITVEAILLTHAHFDHIGGLNKIRETTNAPVYIHRAEQEWLVDPSKNGSALWPDVGGPVVCEKADHDLEDKQELHLLGKKWKVLYTPGHSPGGVSFLVDQHLFSGDALFAQSIGRTDLPGGDYEQLINSIQEKLMVLPDETMVYPGHGPETNIGREKELNPFVTGIID